MIYILYSLWSVLILFIGWFWIAFQRDTFEKYFRYSLIHKVHLSEDKNLHFHTFAIMPHLFNGHLFCSKKININCHPFMAYCKLFVAYGVLSNKLVNLRNNSFSSQPKINIFNCNENCYLGDIIEMFYYRIYVSILCKKHLHENKITTVGDLFCNSIR